MTSTALSYAVAPTRVVCAGNGIFQHTQEFAADVSDFLGDIDGSAP
ncbi:hypothetical protein ACFXG4_06680 [Nocardia sp. NPDC059246]